MEFVKKNIAKWASALILLVIGILCIVAGAASGEASANAFEGISMVIGISLLVISGLVLVIALVASIMSKGEAGFGITAIGVSVALAMGIFFVVNKTLGGELILLFLAFVPYVLIVVGSIIVVDAILNLVFAIVKKSSIKEIIIATVIIALFGVISIVLGALMIGNDPVIKKDVQLIIFGIIIVIFAVLACLATFIAMPTPAKKEAINAEVKDVNEAKEENTTSEEKAE